MTDAVVVGRPADHAAAPRRPGAIACLAQLVNVIAPIRTEPGGPAWRQTIFHPFALTARTALGSVLLTTVHGPEVATARHGGVPQVSGVATFDEQSGLGAVFLVNRSTEVPVLVDLHPRGFPSDTRVLEHLAVFDHDLAAVNVQHDPDRVVPRSVPLAAGGTESAGTLQVRLPPVSWNLVRFGARRPERVDGRGTGEATH